jgi:hypothetical protein
VASSNIHTKFHKNLSVGSKLEMSGITQAYCSVNTENIYVLTVAKKSEYDVKHGIGRRVQGNCIATCHAHLCLCYIMSNSYTILTLHELLSVADTSLNKNVSDGTK